MDFVKKAASSMGNKNQDPAAQQSAQNDDYVDKAFGQANKNQGWGLDKNKQEKVTDGGRAVYEKLTGNKVDPKISN